MRVMTQLRQDAARQLRQEQSGKMAARSAETEQLLNAAAELGVELQPVHPGEVDPLLAPYYMIEVPDRDTAEKVIERLSRFDVVEAAYVKPEEQLP